MAQTILITGPSIAPEAMELMSNNGVRVLNVPPYSSSETVADLVREEQVDGLIVRMGKINSAILEASPRLRVIAKHGVGIDNIDLEAATRLKIPVLITPDANSVSVAEHAVGLMFALAKQMLRLDQRVRRGHWDKSTHKGLELSGKTLGLVGVGRIGRQVINLVSPLNMEILAFDPYADQASMPKTVRMVDDLEQLLRRSDVISCHCPLTPDTKGIIGTAAFNVMKDTAILINTARGGIIDEGALVAALKENTIAGAGLDTFSEEPPSKEHDLWKYDNVIVSPHVAGVTRESLSRMGIMAASLALDVLAQRPVDPACVVNAHVLS